MARRARNFDPWLHMAALLCSAALLLIAGATGARAAVFSFEAVAVSGVNSGAIATDAAGRLYVPARGSGRVYIYDNARRGNKVIGQIGAGILQDPVAVAVDNRLNIYVADAMRNAIVFFAPFISGADYNGADGTQGGAIGQLSGPSSLAVDPEPRLYVAERGNARVQAFDPARGKLTNLFAFGTAEPAPYGPPDAVAIDRLNRFYVTSASGGLGVRYFDARGVFIGTAVAGGDGAGQVDAPQGVTVDPYGRLIVSDTGHDRVTLFGSEAFAFGPFGEYGTTGAGEGQFNAPTYSALAPGAMLYVVDSANNRIVRLRFDDADSDGAIDAGDSCRGIANADQLDHDGDGAGNPCDTDDDGDGIADAADPCPTTKPLTDANADGCADPVATVSSPRRGRAIFLKGRIGRFRVAGSARADTVGVQRVSVAIRRKQGAACWWWRGSGSGFERGSCAVRRYVRATGRRKWSVFLPISGVTRGSYSVFARAVQRATGLKERSTKPKTHFRLR